MSLIWSALPIAPNDDFDGAPLLRTEFVLEEGHGPVARATLHATAHGIFEAYLNERPDDYEAVTERVMGGLA